MTGSKISVWVVDYGRKHLQLQWIDPVTGQRRTKSSGCTRRRDAARAALELERDLNARRPECDGLLPWDSFVLEYTDHHLESLAESSLSRSLGVLSVFRSRINPATIGSVSTAVLMSYASILRREGRPETTIATHLRTIRAALSWAADAGYIATVPRAPKIARAFHQRPKGRPLATAEFARMLRHTSSIVTRPCARSWRRLMRGLWLSGLRLDEALSLSWDERRALWIDLDSGPRPLLGIAAEAEKGKRNRLLPLTPDFCRWLLRTPQSARTGPVFPITKRRKKDVLSASHVSRTISAIGRAAGIVVNDAGKFASAHDFRRSFGLRWAQRVFPADLQQLMRHESVETTMTYYSIVDATNFAERLWQIDQPNTTPNTTPNRE